MQVRAVQIEPQSCNTILDILVELKNCKNIVIEKENLFPKAFKTSFNKGKRKKNSSKVSIYKIDKKFPLLGFNSGCYDLNLIKREFHSFYTETDKNEIKTIKRCNQYIAVYTDHTLFSDMVKYLALGYSNANYLKAFTLNECKGFFPYEWKTCT